MNPFDPKPLFFMTGMFLSFASSAGVPGLKAESLSEIKPAYLRRIEQATLKGFAALIDPASGLPVDIGVIEQGRLLRKPEDANMSKTSPTNIGLGLLYFIVCRDRGLCDEAAAEHGVRAILSSLEELETHQGFWFNWYLLTGIPGKKPEPVLNRFLSSLDNGLLDICLMIARAAFESTEIRERIDRLLGRRDYSFFTSTPADSRYGFLNIGYDAEKGAFTGANYAILNTEARAVTLMAVLKKEIPASAWKEQARLVRYYKTESGEEFAVVAPWGGSLYETGFADQLLGADLIAPRAFGVNARRMVRIHQDWGRKISGPGIWGFSNGEVPATQRYEMCGVPSIAYNRHPGTFVTPYSSFLALRYDGGEAALRNLQAMERLNPAVFSPGYGFVDSIDPASGTAHHRVLSLDKGMEVLSIGNFLNSREGKKEIPDYLWQYFESRGWTADAIALLQAEEELPAFQSLAKPPGEGLEKAAEGKRLSVFETAAETVDFYEEGRAWAGHQQHYDAGEKRELLLISYDVRERYSYSGTSFKFDGLDGLSGIRLHFKSRGMTAGFPLSVKVEVKKSSQPLFIEHIEVHTEWRESSFLIPFLHAGGFDEISFVIENAAAEKNPRGSFAVSEFFVTGIHGG